MKVLVTGVNGQLGYDVCRHLLEQGIEYVGVDYADFDLTDAQAVRENVLRIKPDVIVHCAAYTAVDKAESETVKCMRINGEGTLNLVRAATEIDAALLYVSTDYVFEGTGDTPFETDAPVRPQNTYGLSKLQGEYAVRGQMKRYFIVRTSWVYGLHGHNFVKTMINLGSTRNDINVVCDQIGSPTYSDDLAYLICQMIQTKKYGVYHATNEGFCSWAEFAQEIMDQNRLACKVHPIPTSEYPTPARRPLNSRLSKASLDAAGFARLPSWQDALRRYIIQLHAEQAAEE